MMPVTVPIMLTLMFLMRTDPDRVFWSKVIIVALKRSES